MKTEIACAFALAALASASPLLTAAEPTTTEAAAQKHVPWPNSITRVKRPSAPAPAAMSREMDIDEEDESKGSSSADRRVPDGDGPDINEQLCFIPEGCRVRVADKTITIPAGKHFPSELVGLPPARNLQLELDLNLQPRPPRRTAPPARRANIPPPPFHGVGIPFHGRVGMDTPTPHRRVAGGSEGYVQHTPTKPAFPPDDWPLAPEETGASAQPHWDWSTFPRDEFPEENFNLPDDNSNLPEDNFVLPTDVPVVQKRQLVPEFLWRPRDAVDGDNPAPDSQREAGRRRLHRGRPGRHVPLKGHGVQDFFLARTRPAATATAAAAAEAAPQATPAAGGGGGGEGGGEEQDPRNYPWWSLGLVNPGPVLPDDTMEFPEVVEVHEADEEPEAVEEYSVRTPERIESVRSKLAQEIIAAAKDRGIVGHRLEDRDEDGYFSDGDGDVFHKEDYGDDEDDEDDEDEDDVDDVDDEGDEDDVDDEDDEDDE